MYSSDKLFQRSREGHFGVYFPSCEATRQINTKITLEWAQKQFVMRVHTSFYFLHDITNPIIKIKTTILTHCPSVSLTGFRSAADVTIDCWWRQNDQTIAITRIVVSNSFDIDFIHGDIHGRSCKILEKHMHTIKLGEIVVQLFKSDSNLS